MMAARGADAYRRVDAQSRSSLELVVMLYDGALRFLGEARAAAAVSDGRQRAHAVSRALAVVGELQNTLNMRDGGAVAAELDRLYTYITQRLLDVTTTGDNGGLDEVETLLATLRDGWTQVAAAGARA